MTRSTQSQSEFSKPSETYDFQVGNAATETRTDRTVCEIVKLDERRKPEQKPAPGYGTVRDLVSKWSKDPARRSALADARKWLGSEVLKDQDGNETIRSYRLRKGLSQLQLAQMIGTSQPHIARIEKGSADPNLDTCRRLARALGLDMNTLDKALQRLSAE